MISHQKSFSLLELMVVIAIIAFLGVIAVPQYFQYIAKARQTEAIATLASLHTAMRAYYAEHGRYTSVLWGENSIGWRPEGYHGGGRQEKFHYTYGFNVPGAQEGVHYFTGKLEAPSSSLQGSSVNDHAFVACAVGDVSGKNNLDVWQVDQDRRIDNVKKGI